MDQILQARRPALQRMPFWRNEKMPRGDGDSKRVMRAYRGRFDI